MAELYCPCCAKQINAEFCPVCRIPTIITKPNSNTCFCAHGESLGRYIAKRINDCSEDQDALFEIVEDLTGFEDIEDIKRYLGKIEAFNQ